jgi:hypothetical protein
MKSLGRSEKGEGQISENQRVKKTKGEEGSKKSEVATRIK